jgi:tRNA dimethylallyltransferase
LAADSQMDKPLIVIVGPTASGKSALALDLAAAFRGEVVGCDSVQLYRGFDIGAAKVLPEERRGIPHHMLDLLDPRETCTAGDYGRRARAVLQEISGRGRLPIVVGGTGFYLKALLDGLPELPERDDPLRTRLELREAVRPGTLHRLLRRLDPASAARIHANDTQKLIRALEVRVLTRENMPPRSAASPLTGYRILEVGLSPDRAELHRVLEQRSRWMFDSGLLNEVRRLLSSGCTGEEKPFESLGYKQALMHIRGELTLDQAIASTTLETRQFAKRQWTWFRRDPRVLWIEGFGTETAVIEKCFAVVRGFVSMD